MLGKIEGRRRGQLLRARVRYSARGKGHEEGGSTYTKAGSSLRSPPEYSRAFSPKKPGEGASGELDSAGQVTQPGGASAAVSPMPQGPAQTQQSCQGSEASSGCPAHSPASRAAVLTEKHDW